MGNCIYDKDNKLFKQNFLKSNGHEIIKSFIQKEIFDHHQNMANFHLTCCCICHINYFYNTCTRCHKNEFLSMLIKKYQVVTHQACLRRHPNPVKKQILEFQDNYFCMNYDAQLNNFVCNQDILTKTNASLSGYGTLKFPPKRIYLTKASNYVERDDSGTTKIDFKKHENLPLTSNFNTQKINDNILVRN